ncbi:hypothetical protein D3C79_994400 [compost metagenome]
MGFHRFDRKGKPGSDFASGFAPYDQAQDFQLPCSEVMAVDVWLLALLRTHQRLVDHRVGDGRAEVALATA